MRSWLKPKAGALVAAVLFLLAGGLAYALTEVVKDVGASITVSLKVPDGIEVYSDADLTQPVDRLDFGEVEADVFGTIIDSPTITVYVHNRSNSAIELRLEDDFGLGEILFGFGGAAPRPGSSLGIVLDPGEALEGAVGLRLTRGEQGRHDFTTSFVASGPIAVPTPTPVIIRPGKRGGHPLGSTNVEITHFGIHECAGSDNTCLAHPAPNYNGLIEYNPETDDISDIRCDLCTTWKLALDGVTYTFRLHRDARWNNGLQGDRRPHSGG